ncbi:MAG TPA: universal stress protein [Thermoflexia bacterium]|nr:universal stress protein [Thermoflexia bacterium]
MSQLFWQAAQDFRAARRAADVEHVLARLSGRSNELLSYEEVRKKLHATAIHPQGVRDIPLDAIIGSEGRYTDFTRTFLPKQESDMERWTRVNLAVQRPAGLGPIEVYQIGEAYFVRDGNHRVSVARQLGATYIQAYVNAVETSVSLTPDTGMAELILKAEYADFLKSTGVAEWLPDVNFELTIPGHYWKLEEHIDVHRYFMGMNAEREISPAEAISHWYETVYLPVVRVIRERGLLRDFPTRTETDLYLWLLEHRAELTQTLGWEVATEEAASHLTAEYSPHSRRLAARIGEHIRAVLTPDTLSAGPPVGSWRAEQGQVGSELALFPRILVPFQDNQAGWQAVEQALSWAAREAGQIRGLHITAAGEPAAAGLKEQFARRCQEAEVLGQLSITSGDVTQLIYDRSRWVDLVVISLTHPPEPQPLARWNSGFRSLISRCPRPVLAVPGPARPLRRALLAYDGSPKAREALFVAAYLAGRWNISLAVLTVMDPGPEMAEILADAQRYLAAQDCCAAYHNASGPVAETILRTAASLDSDLLIMGGYSLTPWLEIVMGSTVDQVSRESDRPLLLCR